MERLPTSRGCIICGTENPIGLKVRFAPTEDGVQTQIQPGKHYQGFDGVVQGGVIAGLMDDAMWYAIYATSQVITMTAELTVRYKSPVPTETLITVSGQVVNRRHSLFTCAATVIDPDGKILAQATGKFLPAPKPIAGDRARTMG